jgi:hypothetical protein
LAGFTLGFNVEKYLLYTLLVKIAVLTVTNDVSQQACSIYSGAFILNYNSCPIRLTGDGAITF